MLKLRPWERIFKIHKQGYDGFIMCGTYVYKGRYTAFNDQVTCKRCLDLLNQKLRFGNKCPLCGNKTVIDTLCHDCGATIKKR